MVNIPNLAKLNSSIMACPPPISTGRAIPIIPEQIKANPKVQELWSTLHKLKLITDEKYTRLISNTPFTEKQLGDFIARQLVETGQGTKGIADLLEQLFTDTDIVYAKASNVSDFRRDNGFLKSRLVNDFHHAQDAYLNIVVGNVYYTKFTRNPWNFIRKDYEKDKEKNRYNLAKMFEWNVIRGSEAAWIAERKDEKGTIATVRAPKSNLRELVYSFFAVLSDTSFDTAIGMP